MIIYHLITGVAHARWLKTSEDYSKDDLVYMLGEKIPVPFIPLRPGARQHQHSAQPNTLRAETSVNLTTGYLLHA